jgi:hypothetical protein
MHRSRRLFTVLALAAAVVAFPLGALASHSFADVPDSNPFHADISALASSGVTSGCGGGNFCPGANVTREQMAAFMNRLGALAPGKTPVVNADKLDGLDSSAFVRPDYMDHSYLGPWMPSLSSNIAVVTYGHSDTYISRASAGGESFTLAPQVPGVENLTTYALTNVSFCVTASASAYVDIVIVKGTKFGEGAVFSVEDTTNRTVSGCYAYPISTPVPANAVSLVLWVGWTGNAAITIHETTFTWAPWYPA